MVKPLCIRREELAVQAARIIIKPDDSYLKVRWNIFLDRDATERKISPFGKMNVQLADMSNNKGISYIIWKKSESILSPCSPPNARQSIGKILGHPSPGP